MEQEYRFEFSIIMSVYNVEPYIREAIDSLIRQDFGFEKVQLILVDDGSPDGSGAICDEYAARYPENIVVIHKENGGLSSARNAGARASAGRYLNFCDPDDWLDPNVLSSVHRFFEEHGDETDVVAIPFLLFGDQEGDHPSNKKFRSGNRVIDLEKNWVYFQMSLAASFLKTDVAKRFCFHQDLDMVDAEDGKEIIKIFINKPTLGVVQDGVYHYRRHNDSQVTRSNLKPGGFVPYLRDFTQWVLQYAEAQCGTVPKFVQHMVMYHLQWKVRAQHLPLEVLSEEEAAEYSALLKSLLVYFDDEVILEQAYLNAAQKTWLLEQKYGKPMKVFKYRKSAFLGLDDTLYYAMDQFEVCWEFLTIENGVCELEGYITVLPPHLEEQGIELEVNEERIPCELVERTGATFVLDEPSARRVGFRARFPLVREDEKYVVNVFVKISGVEYQARNFVAGKYFPVCRRFANSYWVRDGWKVILRKTNLQLRSCGRLGHLRSELALLGELWKKNVVGSRKAVAARLAYHVAKPFVRRRIWLISDKANRADDNGEAMFKYLCEIKPPEIRCIFLIAKESADYKRLKKLGPVVPYMSWRHKLLHLLADYTISAYSHNEIKNPFGNFRDPYRDLLQKCKYVFLQHGVTKDDVSEGLNLYHKNIELFICCAGPEYDSILANPAYGYDERHVALTGFPRYDRLYRAEEKAVVIMPTWRSSLFGAYHEKDSRWDLLPGFEESDYYTFYDQLISHPRLLERAEALGYAVHFVPHPVLFPYLDHFHVPAQVRMWGTEVVYRDMFAKCDLLLTDYSSVAFDFAYLRKPVLYTHFDSNHYAEGYFDYERDGFGEVEYDLEGTVDRIVEYMENGCQLKDVYRARIDAFFAFNDRNNCRRVYESILALENGK